MIPILGRVPAEKRPAHAARDQMEGTTTGFIDQHSAGEWHAGEYMVLTDLSRVNLCLSMISLHIRDSSKNPPWSNECLSMIPELLETGHEDTGHEDRNRSELGHVDTRAGLPPACPVLPAKEIGACPVLQYGNQV